MRPDLVWNIPVENEVLIRELQNVKKICVSLTREKTPVYEKETIFHCYELSSLMNITDLEYINTFISKRIEFTIRGKYAFYIVLLSENYEPYGYVKSEFEFGTSSTCLSKIKNRYNPTTTVTEYNKNWYEDGTVMAYMSPLCSDEYNDYKEEEFLMLPTNSAFRGSFGVDSLTSMEFGHGDVMVLNFVLIKHPNIKNIVELGTFAGITSFHWGIAAGLRGGVLNSFDINDYRSDSVKRLWSMQQHMSFHIADVMQFQKEGEVMDKTLKYHVENNCDLLFVDAAHKGKSRLDQATEYGKLMQKVGSIIFVHDFPGHIAYSEWVDSLAALGFIYRYHHVIKNTKSTVGIFERVTLSSTTTDASQIG
eukprot:g6494.t1